MCNENYLSPRSVTDMWCFLVLCPKVRQPWLFKQNFYIG